MDAIRTLLLARTHVVVLDPDVAAGAATRPSRDGDVEKFEDELAQIGFVMSLDLALTIRRMPNQAIQELRSWIVTTLAKTLGAHRPHVPLFRRFPGGTPGNTVSLYLRRMVSWLLTRADQPCPWCGETKPVRALDPCGHLVCNTCWGGGSYAGCPMCHRRVALGDPFVGSLAGPQPEERVKNHDGQLRLLHLAFDLLGTARARFEALLARTTPLSPDDRAEVEAVIDTLGPKAASWLPKKIAVRETMALAVARLWMISPDRHAMLKATADQLKTATDVLRVAAVLMGGNAGLVEPMRLGTIPRGLRKLVLEALDRLPAEAMLEDIRRYPGLWKRAGERLHPFEHAVRLPTAALAFAVVRGTDVAKVTFGATLRAQADQLASLRIEDDRVRVTPWAGVVEDALRSGDVRALTERLASRPGELLRRADHLVRVTQARQPEALGGVLRTIQNAMTRGAPGTLLGLGTHVAARGAPWPRRVFLPKGEVLKAWSTPDERAPLRADAIGSIGDAVRTELLVRAESRRHYARAVIDRALADLLVPLNERTASRAKIAWPRGSEIAVPPGDTLRLFLHWEEPTGTTVDLDLSVALFDAAWRHVATCDFTNLVAGERAAVHSGDLTSAPSPLGASEFVDLDLAKLRALGAQHAVMVVFSYNSVPFDRLTFGFAGLMIAPAEGTHFDPRAVAKRFDLSGRSMITVPLTIDLEAAKLRWLDVHISGRGSLHQVGGYRAALAHIGKDFADLAFARSRPTLWDVACIHAIARANLVYVRERSGAITQYRRRDGESTTTRLSRIASNGGDDGTLAMIPQAEAPTWFCVLRDNFVIPKGSAGYALDRRAQHVDGISFLSAGDLVAELAAKP
ncbi:MAG: hypothetical protein H0T46_01865 [Deltaproteobacteria bacterium]|nr:hypothetical protein [Deltaproteobacteria bacterium]